MQRKYLLALALFVGAVLVLNGCGMSKVKNWITGNVEDEELAGETVPPEAQQETVMIDGKPYVRSKNPYWLSYPDQPEYVYVEKGREFVPLQTHIFNAIAKAMGREQAKAAGKGVPPDKLKELVRAEVDRILKEEGLGGFVSRTQGGEGMTMVGRSVAVIPDLETPRSFEGMNRTMAVALADSLGRQKDIKVSSQDQVREAMNKAGIAGKLHLAPNIKALGDYLGVQGVILTGIVPPAGGSSGALALQVFDTFNGTKDEAVVRPVEGGLKPETVTKFAQDNSLRVAGALIRMPWFGRVEFVKEGKVYLNLGENAGLKVGDRLRVVAPGKEVVNPNTHAVLGYTADIPQGELRVTELLGKSGAVAMPVSGGPFKAFDKVKPKAK